MVKGRFISARLSAPRPLVGRKSWQARRHSCAISAHCSPGLTRGTAWRKVTPECPLVRGDLSGPGIYFALETEPFPGVAAVPPAAAGLSPRPSPGRCRLPLPIPVTWQSARPRSSGASVTALACCWDPANKPFIPPEETKWQARGRRLPRGQGHAPAQRRVRGRHGCRDSGLQSLSPMLISQCLLVFPTFYNCRHRFTYTSEVAHGFTLSVFTI